MLVLTRKPDQTIEIDECITIKVLRVKGKTVRIGIEAPADVPIRRSELREISSQVLSEQQDLGIA